MAQLSGQRWVETLQQVGGARSRKGDDGRISLYCFAGPLDRVSRLDADYGLNGCPGAQGHGRIFPKPFDESVGQSAQPVSWRRQTDPVARSVPGLDRRLTRLSESLDNAAVTQLEPAQLGHHRIRADRDSGLGRVSHQRRKEPFAGLLAEATDQKVAHRLVA